MEGGGGREGLGGSTGTHAQAVAEVGLTNFNTVELCIRPFAERELKIMTRYLGVFFCVPKMHAAAFDASVLCQEVSTNLSAYVVEPSQVSIRPRPLKIPVCKPGSHDLLPRAPVAFPKKIFRER